MHGSIKILVITAAVWISALSPIRTIGAEELKFQHIRSIYDDRGLGLKKPEGVACGAQGHLIVADTANARLLRYRFKDREAEPAGPAITLPQLTYPIQVHLNSKNEIFVLDGKLHRIISITADGKFTGYKDPKRPSSPSSSGAIGFSIDKNDNIYVLDIFSEQVIVLGSQGEYLKHIKLPKDKGFFTDLTVDDRGNVLLLDSVNARVFSTAGQSASLSAITESMKATMRFPAAITTDAQGRIYLVDRNGSKIIILARDGSFLGRLSAKGWKEGLLNYPSQMCINDRGHIFVADTQNNRVQVFVEID